MTTICNFISTFSINSAFLNVAMKFTNDNHVTTGCHDGHKCEDWSENCFPPIVVHSLNKAIGKQGLPVFVS